LYYRFKTKKKIIFMKFQVKGKMLIVGEPDRNEVTPGGIIIPSTTELDKHDIRSWFGEVLAVGEDIADQYTVGDVVIMDPTVPHPMFKHPETKRMAMFVNSSQILSKVKQ